jgi:hypothetical protein
MKILAIIAGCCLLLTGSAWATATPTSTPTATATPIPTPTNTPSPTPTPIPTQFGATPTMTPAITPTALPTCAPGLNSPVLKGSNAAAGRQTVQVGQAAGETAGDLLLADVIIGMPAQSVSADGWTTALTLNSRAYGSNTQALFWKVAGSAEPDKYIFRGSLGEAYSSVILLDFTNVNASPLDGAAAAYATDLVNYGNPPDVLFNITQMTATAPPLVTNYCNDALVVFCGSAEHNYFQPPEAPAAPPGFSYITDVHDYASQIAWSQIPPALGPIGPWTIYAAHAADIKCAAVALRAN